MSKLLILPLILTLSVSCSSNSDNLTSSDRENIDRQVAEKMDSALSAQAQLFHPKNKKSVSLNEHFISNELKIKNYCSENLGFKCLNVTIEGNFIRITINETTEHPESVAALLCEYVRSIGLSGKMVSLRDVSQNTLARQICN